MKKLLVPALASSSSIAFADTTAPLTGQPSSLPSILMLVVFVVIFYFLLIRPQMKRSKEQRQMLNMVEKGDEVITASGLYGKISKIDESTVELEIADKVIVKIQKQAIASMLPKGTLKDAS